VLGLKGRPSAANLVGIYAALSDTTPEKVLTEFGGKGFGEFKPALADLAVDKLFYIQDELRRLMAAPDHVDAVIRSGAIKAQAIAEPTMREIHDKVGFLQT
jgi:tryptophanyl-tRNA synthetase